jgi:hypothetical protein
VSRRRGVPQAKNAINCAVALGVAAQWALARPAIYRLPASLPSLRLGRTTYLEPHAITEITRSAAATLLATHAAAVEEAEARRENAHRIIAAIADSPHVRAILTRYNRGAGYLRLPVRLRTGMAGFALGQKALSLGIARSYPMCIAGLHQVAQRLTGAGQTWPGAQTLVRDLVTVPTHSRLASRDLRAITGIFANYDDTVDRRQRASVRLHT